MVWGAVRELDPECQNLNLPTFSLKPSLPVWLLQVPSTAKAILGKVMEKILLVIISKHMKHIVIVSSQHGFWRGSHIIKLLSFYNEMAGSVDGGRAVDVVYLDFSKGLNAVFCNVLIDKLIQVRSR